MQRWGARGPLVVLLHPGVGDTRFWHGVAEPLAAWARVVAYDRRGYGETEADPEDFAHEEDLARVLDAVAGDEPAWLVGSSQGGRVAIDLALTQPERVSGQVLVAPAVSGAPEPQSEDLEPAERELGDAIDEAFEAGDFETVNRLEARLWLDGPGQPEGRVAGPARELFATANGRVLEAEGTVGEPREPPDALERLGALPGRTLVVWGDLDLSIARDRSAMVAGAVPGAERWVVDGRAHLPYLEDPAQTAGRLRAFIGE